MSEHNNNTRLETFCDGVFAIAMTLLIIDIRIPATKPITDSNVFWLALKEIIPSMLAFILSFIVILITWVNHHNTLKTLNRSSPAFIYANGLMLLTTVFIPFPTSLIGEHIFTNHAAPAVVIYDATLALQALSWILLSGAALKDQLTKDQKAKATINSVHKFGWFAFSLYSVFSIASFWFPLTVAIITGLSWIFWLIYGISFKQEEVNQNN